MNSALAAPMESERVGGIVVAMARQQSKSKQVVWSEFFDSSWPPSLLKRFATVDVVVAMVTYIAGEPSSATGGTGLRVDGNVLRARL